MVLEFGLRLCTIGSMGIVRMGIESVYDWKCMNKECGLSLCTIGNMGTAGMWIDIACNWKRGNLWMQVVLV